LPLEYCEKVFLAGLATPNRIISAAWVVHRSKFEQTKEYPYETTTYVCFTRLLMSYPQSCPREMGMDRELFSKQPQVPVFM
jgi:hypothetical protein